MNRYHMTEHFYSSVEAILLTLLMENFRTSKSAKGKMEMVVIGVSLVDASHAIRPVHLTFALLKSINDHLSAHMLIFTSTCNYINRITTL